MLSYIVHFLLVSLSMSTTNVFVYGRGDRHSDPPHQYDSPNPPSVPEYSSKPSAMPSNPPSKKVSLAPSIDHDHGIGLFRGRILSLCRHRHHLCNHSPYRVIHHCHHDHIHRLPRHTLPHHRDLHSGSATSLASAGAAGRFSKPLFRLTSFRRLLSKMWLLSGWRF